MLSFNNPQGMCPECDGLGRRYDFDPELLVPDPKRNFLAPCIAAYRTKFGKWARHILDGVALHYGFRLKTPWKDLPAKAREVLLHGSGGEIITYEWQGGYGTYKHAEAFTGAIAELRARYKKSESQMVRRFYEQFMRERHCEACDGSRLNRQAMSVRLTGRIAPDAEVRSLAIHEIGNLPVRDALHFFHSLKLDGVGEVIAQEPLKEIRARLSFLMDVGLDYLSLDRPAPSLSGGESQRIRLASQIGCGLVGVLYVLDEPSIGLHPRDNQRLIQSLRRLRDIGNTVIVVEHDKDTMEAADEIVDFGPGPGSKGGRVLARGTVGEVAANPDSVTGAYLSGREKISTPANRRPVSKPPTDRAPRKRAQSG
jgi:excinuclease ABC subunit A